MFVSLKVTSWPLLPNRVRLSLFFSKFDAFFKALVAEQVFRENKATLPEAAIPKRVSLTKPVHAGHATFFNPTSQKLPSKATKHVTKELRRESF
jgi:hypothetical protein